MTVNDDEPAFRTALLQFLEPRLNDLDVRLEPGARLSRLAAAGFERRVECGFEFDADACRALLESLVAFLGRPMAERTFATFRRARPIDVFELLETQRRSVGRFVNEYAAMHRAMFDAVAAARRGDFDDATRRVQAERFGGRAPFNDEWANGFLTELVGVLVDGDARWMYLAERQALLEFVGVQGRSITEAWRTVGDLATARLLPDHAALVLGRRPHHTDLLEVVSNRVRRATGRDVEALRDDARYRAWLRRWRAWDNDMHASIWRLEERAWRSPEPLDDADERHELEKRCIAAAQALLTELIELCLARGLLKLTAVRPAGWEGRDPDGPLRTAAELAAHLRARLKFVRTILDTGFNETQESAAEISADLRNVYRVLSTLALPGAPSQAQPKFAEWHDAEVEAHRLLTWLDDCAARQTSQTKIADPVVGTITEIFDRTSVSKDMLRRRLKDGRLRGRKLPDGRYEFSSAELEALKDQCEAKRARGKRHAQSKRKT